MDGQFGGIQGKICGDNIWIHISSRNEHVPEIDILKVKEKQEVCSMLYQSRECQIESIQKSYKMTYSGSILLQVKMKFLEATVQEKNIKAHCVLEEHSHSMVQRTTGAISFRTT